MKRNLTFLIPYRRTALTASGLVTATLITSVTGFVFWWLAAHLFSQEAVGLAGAAVSAIILLSQVAELGLGTKLVDVLHRDDRPLALASTALLATGMAGSALGLAFGLIAPQLFTELAPLSSDAIGLVLFVMGVALSAVGSVLDQILAAMSHDLRRLIRNSTFAIIRLGLLPLTALVFPNGGVGLYAAWVGALIASLVIVLAWPMATRPQDRVRPLRWGQLGRMAGDSMSHHVLNLSRSSSVWLLPLIVTVVVSQEANASFYVAFLLTNFISLVGSSTTFTLYIVGARDPGQLWQQIRFTLFVSTSAAVLGTAGLWLLGRDLLGTFGQAYAVTAYPTVVILAASTLPLAVKDHWISLQRIRGNVRQGSIVGLATLALEVLASCVGALTGGVVGLSLARLFVLGAQALIMAGPIVAAMTHPPAGASVAGLPSPPPVSQARIEQ
jgi:O-antigen/teichoic acid export membrane protein